MLFASTLAILAASVLPSAYAQTNATNPLIVSTNVGTFQGAYNSNQRVRSWLGIRYGRPTNGTRRFRPPQRALALPTNSTFNATLFSPGCPNAGQVAGTGTTAGDDCLSLNIWAPSTDRTNSTSGATVLIWIYGGGFTSGNTAIDLYNGNNFVRDQEDIIVVSINYRISIYGFPAGSGASRYNLNAGLQDQRLAIEWVYNNIRHFGGDPAKITLFGESAGASSIGAYAYTYRFDPIARGLIMQSGSEFLNGPISVPVNNTASTVAWNTIAETIGCNSTSQSTRFTCMQNANMSILSSAVSRYNRTRTAFLPTRDGVNLLETAELTAAGLAGEFAPLPVLLGTNNNEGTSLTSSYGGGSASLADTITITSFTCPAAQVAEDRQNASVPVWQYRYFGTWPNITPPNSTLGAFHGAEIALVFGNYNQTTTYNVSRAQVQTSQIMQAAWTAFAKNPSTGLTEYGWPQFQSNGSTLIELAKGYFNQSQAVLEAATLPIVTFNSSQAYNGVC